MNCDRCDIKLSSKLHTSWYNDQRICSYCRGSEMSRADYEACRKAERQAIKNGDYNFSFLPPWKEVHSR